MKTGLPNRDPVSGIRYGVISQHSVADYALDIVFNGADLRYESHRKDLIGQLQRAVADIGDVSDVSKLPDDVIDYIGDIADSLMESHECDDCPRYYEERDPAGAITLAVQTMPDLNCLWVFKSPMTKMVQECSPCVPGAGDLDSGEGSVEAYALPANWLRED